MQAPEAAAHWVHDEGVPVAQHRPPPHTPLVHSVWVAHVAPTALGVTQAPVADTTLPLPHAGATDLHAPVFSPRAVSNWLQEVQEDSTPGWQHTSRHAPEEQSSSQEQYVPGPRRQVPFTITAGGDAS